MPRDLFTALAASPQAAARARLVPCSFVLHVLALAAVVIAPLLAIGPLPPVRAPLTYRVTQVALPRVPAAASAGPSRKVPLRAALAPAQAAPTAAPAGIAREPLPAVAAGVPSAESFAEIGGASGVPEGVTSYGVAVPLPSPPSHPAPVRVGGRISAPRKIHDVPPVYPAIAQQARVEGLVIIDAVIGPDGRVQDARVIRSTPLLDVAALDAVRQWRFTPTLLNGQPVAVVMTVTVRFALQR